MNRIYWVWQFEEEEQWLNQMAADGWVLQKAKIGQYIFARSEPGEYILRLEILDKWPRSQKSQNYIRFVESTGAECICTFKRWVYFRKKAAKGEFELFSDLNSRIHHMERMLLLGALDVVLALDALNMLRHVPELAFGTDLLVATACVLAVAAMAVWVGQGFCKIWRLRKKLQDESSLRE